ncbi:hypothetical protein Tco_0361088 [Tanacetum coccineum]
MLLAGRAIESLQQENSSINGNNSRHNLMRCISRRLLSAELVGPKNFILNPGQIHQGSIPNDKRGVLFQQCIHLCSTMIAQDAPSTSASSSTSDMHHPVRHQEIAEEPTHEDPPINNDVLHPSHNLVTGEPGSVQSSSGSVNSADPNQVNYPPDHLKRWTKDHPLDNIVGQSLSSVSTRIQLALRCFMLGCLHKGYRQVDGIDFVESFANEESILSVNLKEFEATQENLSHLSSEEGFLWDKAGTKGVALTHYQSSCWPTIISFKGAVDPTFFTANQDHLKDGVGNDNPVPVMSTLSLADDLKKAHVQNQKQVKVNNAQLLSKDHYNKKYQLYNEDSKDDQLLELKSVFSKGDLTEGRLGNKSQGMCIKGQREGYRCVKVTEGKYGGGPGRSNRGLGVWRVGDCEGGWELIGGSGCGVILSEDNWEWGGMSREGDDFVRGRLGGMRENKLRVLRVFGLEGRSKGRNERGSKRKKLGEGLERVGWGRGELHGGYLGLAFGIGLG